jgi:polyphenol oxidase
MHGPTAAALLAAVGPCISADHFEVGPEVAAEFARTFPGDRRMVRPGARDRSMIDLKEALRCQLIAAGVEQHDVSPCCTYGDSSSFYSHRRDRGLTGRTAALIGPRAG